MALARNELADAYLNLLASTLLNELYVENEARLVHTFFNMLNGGKLDFLNFYAITSVEAGLIGGLREAKRTGSQIVLSKQHPDGSSTPTPELRNVLELSHTMIGRLRLDNLRHCLETVLDDDVPGDVIETGIWRGGACIFMRGILKAYGVRDRVVWAADSFEGVPPPTRPEDAGLDLSKTVLPVLAVPVEEVQALFERYGLFDEQVRFLEGWFKDTLATAPIERLAILRLDGDLYESTMDALEPLYDKVSPGGFVIVDDYGSCPPCRQAIEDFRRTRGITAPLQTIDAQSVYWRKG